MKRKPPIFENNLMKKSFIFILAFTFLIINLPFNKAFGQNANTDSVRHSEVAPLFKSEEPLKFTLVIDIREIRNDNSENPEYSKGKLILHDDSAQDIEFDIKSKARGNARRLFEFCSFPPIKLNFKKKAVKGTVFEGQDKLKLVAYCKDNDLFEDYVLQEYLLYKVYNKLTPYSFQVRLAEITYQDINDKAKEVVRYGFLIEDDDMMAERNGGKVSEILLSNHDRCDREILDTFVLFEYMIGNTDWWIAAPKVHNGILIHVEGKMTNTGSI